MFCCFHSSLMGFCIWFCSITAFGSMSMGSKWRWNSIFYYIYKIIPYEQCTSFEENGGQNDHWSSHVSVYTTVLCLDHYFVQHIFVFIYLPKFSCVHLSHVNVPWSYYPSLVLLWFILLIIWVFFWLEMIYQHYSLHFS